MDLTGIPSCVAEMKRLFPELSNTSDVPAIIQKLVDAGANGISAGKGFYRYTPIQREQWEKFLRENARHTRPVGDIAASLEKNSEP